MEGYSGKASSSSDGVAEAETTAAHEYSAVSTITARTMEDAPGEWQVLPNSTPEGDVASEVSVDGTMMKTPSIINPASKRQRSGEYQSGNFAPDTKRACAVQATVADSRDEGQENGTRGRKVIFEGANRVAGEMTAQRRVNSQGEPARAVQTHRTPSLDAVLHDFGGATMVDPREEDRIGRYYQFGQAQSQAFADSIIKKFRERHTAKKASVLGGDGSEDESVDPPLPKPSHRPSRSPPSRLVYKDFGEFVPANIVSQVPPMELMEITEYMSNKGYEVPMWPTEVFANLYLRKGCKSSVRSYCNAELKHIELMRKYALQAPRAKRSKNHMCSSSDDSDYRREKVKLQRDLARREHLISLITPEWNLEGEDDESERGELDLTDIFPEVDDKVRKQLLPSIPRYDPTLQSDLADWLTWVNKVCCHP